MTTFQTSATDAAYMAPEAPRIEYKLWPGQAALLRDTRYPDHIYAAGVGTGKSVFGVRHLEYARVSNGGGYKYGVLAPTEKLVKYVNLEYYIKYLNDSGYKENVHYSINRANLIIKFPHSNDEVFFVTANNYKTIIGYTFASVWVDEPGWMSAEVYPEIAKRVRANAKLVRTLRTGVPQGVGDSTYFDECTGPEYISKGSYEIPTEGTFTRFRCDGRRVILHSSTHENPENDSGYIARLKDQIGWSRALWLQQVHGMFVAATSNSLFDFDEQKHTAQLDLGQYSAWIASQGAPLYLAWDFNVGQVTWLLFCEIDGTYYCLAENGSNARDTPAACEQFIKTMLPYNLQSQRIVVLGDSSGWSRDTRSISCDYNLIRDTLKGQVGALDMKAQRSNPDIRMTVLAVNRLLAKQSLIVDAKCRKFINSLQTTAPDGKGGIVKPTGDTWTHPADAGRYFVWHVAPINLARGGGVTI